MSAIGRAAARQRVAKRQAVLDAATALFMAQGYGAVSMDAIARAAGVSKATLYAYFSSKDQFFATIISDACQQNIAATIPAGRRDGRARRADRSSPAACCASCWRIGRWRSTAW